MKWTTTYPTKPGIYRYRNGGEEMLVWVGGGQVPGVQGEWLGPIEDTASRIALPMKVGGLDGDDL